MNELDDLKGAVNRYCTAFLAKSVYGECKAFCPFYPTNSSEIPKCSQRYIEKHPKEIREILKTHGGRRQ